MLPSDRCPFAGGDLKVSCQLEAAWRIVIAFEWLLAKGDRLLELWGLVVINSPKNVPNLSECSPPV
jgi:hypothetical protein